jgi:hypothetical protein
VSAVKLPAGVVDDIVRPSTHHREESAGTEGVNLDSAAYCQENKNFKSQPNNQDFNEF